MGQKVGIWSPILFGVFNVHFFIQCVTRGWISRGVKSLKALEG